MKNLIRLIGWLIILALVVKGGMWGYENFISGGTQDRQQPVLDIDKNCRENADTGQCICRHRQTGERLKIVYEECVSLARGKR